MPGSTLVVTDVSTPLGAAMAHRLAAESATLVIGGARGPATDASVEDVMRIRALHRMTMEPLVVQADDGAEALVRESLDSAVEAFGRVDGLVHAVDLVRSPQAGLPASVTAPLRQALNRMPSGARIILGIETSGLERREPDGSLLETEAALESIVRAAARLRFEDDLCVNGVFVGTRASAADHSLALTSGLATNGTQVGSTRTSSIRTAAATMAAMLVSAATCGITGQVFRVGGKPPASLDGDDLSAVLSRSGP